MKTLLSRLTSDINPAHFCLSRSCRPASARHLRAYSTSKGDRSVQDALRALLRETAQPVAVVTSLMPLPSESPHPSAASPTSRFHGATLSSFSSIALHPHPLVAFSLRIPSRLATSLKSAHATCPSSSSSSPSTPDPPVRHAPAQAHMVVNLLSATQADVAVRFSQPHRFPDPFAGVPHRLSADGLPVLDGALGALSCTLVAPSWPLHDLDALRRGDKGEEWEGGDAGGGDAASELFIARVARVEDVGAPESCPSEDASRASPLLYYRRAYTTTRDADLPLSAAHSRGNS
ncbi:hypothetical protein WOLCODRAFT_123625 [Wolfiporia cocos MD-104 SS10]|uniref:Flavin reductase like domain-containing protein n=1 Tax=Wolfiporia cocos (strain MD-104) TaxID=742152 RepID=A0A2H3JWW7_WOLCO|nr:hypothetical protein WOLCODRAFT_123625 [Wolfiporia cocos MD-104 SS10]